MSCGPSPAKFRLLDAYVGWSHVPPPDSLEGLDDPGGLRLALLDEGLPAAELWKRVLPPRLARGCGPCDWYLLTPPPSRLLALDACSARWTPVWTAHVAFGELGDAFAVAAWDRRIAIAARDGGIRVWDRGGDAFLAEIRVPAVVALGFSPRGEILAAAAGDTALRRFGPDGLPRAPWAALPANVGDVEAITPGGGCEVFIVTLDGNGVRRLWRASRDDAAFAEAALDVLPFHGVSVATDRGFCFGRAQHGIAHTACYDWFGRVATEDAVGSAAPPRRAAKGGLATVALDSGIARCRWHRVRVDGDVPHGTAVAVRVATTEDPAAQPHAADWKGGPAGALDFLVDQPPGRYVHLQLELRGDGVATPVVRRIRIDFPRSTSLEYLPAIYRENPRSEDFTERFLAIFDAEIGKVDRAIERFPAMLDGQGVRDEVLPWLGGFLDVVFEPGWEAARRRRILRALPRLYALRGTAAGLRLAIRVIFDTDAAIQELGSERMWGKLGAQGTAALRGTRLFGRARARLRLGRSRLGAAPLMSRGNPDRDPLATGAFRFRVLVPPLAPEARARLERLVEAQKPAHTQASIRIGGSGFLLGSGSALGIDTALVPLAAPVLGRAGNVRLGRASVLWSGRRGPRPAVILGRPIVAGIHTVME